MNFIILSILCLISIIKAVESKPTYTTWVAPEFKIDLDLSPAERWREVTTHYKPQAPLLEKYFQGLAKNVPAVAAKLIKWIAADIARWGSMTEDMREELKALSEQLDIDFGTIVALNMMYELRWLGPPGNSTGPRPEAAGNGPNACSSIVAEDTENHVWHARNLDFQLPNAIRNMTFKCNFYRDGKPLYSAGCMVGFVGVFSAIKPGVVATTIDHRHYGGNVVVDALTALLRHAYDPTHLLRFTMESALTFDTATELLTNTHLAAPVYYISSGPASGNGVVLERDRIHNHYARWLNVSASAQEAFDAHLSSSNVKGGPPTTWFIYQSNYDWDTNPPSFDDRRKYGLKFMTELGRENAQAEKIYDHVLTKNPVRNDHTSYVFLANVKTGWFKLLIVNIHDE